MAAKSPVRSASGQSAARLLLTVDAWAALAAATVLILIIVGAFPR
jgi:hypothetical protein